MHYIRFKFKNKHLLKNVIKKKMKQNLKCYLYKVSVILVIYLHSFGVIYAFEINLK